MGALQAWKTGHAVKQPANYAVHILPAPPAHTELQVSIRVNAEALAVGPRQAGRHADSSAIWAGEGLQQRVGIITLQACPALRKESLLHPTQQL
jgi:hypothetical protein